MNFFFPVVDRWGKLPPPPSYLSSTTRLHQWRRLTKALQQHHIKKEQDGQAGKVDNQPIRRRHRRSMVTAAERLDPPTNYNVAPYSSVPYLIIEPPVPVDTATTDNNIVQMEHDMPNHPGHNIIQRRHGSDVCEETFCLKRNANANADTKGTDNILSTKHGGVITNLSASRKSNFGKRKTFFGQELGVGKVKRQNFD